MIVELAKEMGVELNNRLEIVNRMTLECITVSRELNRSAWEVGVYYPSDEDASDEDSAAEWETTDEEESENEE